MSDKSSESSCEWVVLNEDEDLDLDNSNEQSLNLELSYEAISCAVSDSIRSSFSSDELEWQYEQYENYIPPQRHFIQEVVSRNFDDSDDCRSEDSNVEDEIINECSSTDIEEEDNIDVASTPKIHSYKHNRNDHLNFILNFCLSLVIASAIGLGIGHFLGWSHKCLKSTSVAPHAAANDMVELLHAVKMEQENDDNKHSQHHKSLSQLPGNMLNSVSCTNLKDKDSSTHHNIFSASMNANIAFDSALTETSIIMTSDVLELKTHEELPQNNFSNPFTQSTVTESEASAKIDWNDLSVLEAAAKRIYELKEISSDETSMDSLNEDEVNNIELELFPRSNINGKVSDTVDADYDSETPLSVNEKDNLSFKNKLDNNGFEFLKEYFNEKQNSDMENNFTNQLRKDLNEVVHSLTAIVFARLSDFDEKHPTSIGKSGSLLKLFSDFQTLINTRITDIENFVNSIEYKDASKFNLKYLQKMVYTLVDSVDYLMKVSFKSLSKEGKRINIRNFSNNVSKVIFNFNKKWEKNNRFWFESLEKFRTKNLRDGHRKKGRENKYWKNKAQFEKQSKRNFKYRNSMKS